MRKLNFDHVICNSPIKSFIYCSVFVFPGNLEYWARRPRKCILTRFPPRQFSSKNWLESRCALEPFLRKFCSLCWQPSLLHITGCTHIWLQRPWGSCSGVRLLCSRPLAAYRRIHASVWRGPGRTRRAVCCRARLSALVCLKMRGWCHDVFWSSCFP